MIYLIRWDFHHRSHQAVATDHYTAYEIIFGAKGRGGSNIKVFAEGAELDWERGMIPKSLAPGYIGPIMAEFEEAP